MSDSDLPQGWSWIPLGKLIQPVMTRDTSQESGIEFTYFDISSIDNELGAVTNPKRVLSSKAPSRARQVVEAGDVLFSTVRPYLRGIAQVPVTENGVASSGFCVLRPAGSISAKYLYYFVRSDDFLDGLLPLQRGASYPAVRKDDVLAQLVPVAPIAEQTRIVEKLEELLTDLDAGVAELKAAQNKLLQYRKSLLKAAVDGTLTAEWRAEHAQRGEAVETGAQLLERILTERRARWESKQLTKYKEQGKTPPKAWQDKYPEPMLPDTTVLSALPEGWVWASLDMVGEIVSGVAKGSKRNANTKMREVPYLRVANVQRGYLDLAEVKTIMATEWDIEELTLRSGDVLFNEGGDRDKLGRGCVWRDEIANCIHQNHVFRMRPYLQEVLPELVSHHGNTVGKAWFRSAGKQTTNLASINLSILREFPVPIAPAVEQQEILSQLVKQIDLLNDQEQSVALGLRQAEAQRKNILKAAFSGQLVPQDPNDEPACTLLERISAEREEREKQSKPRAIKMKKEIPAMVTKLKDVLAEAADWMPAQEAFRRCGVADSAHTDQVEALYAELRELDKSNQLAVESVTDAQGRKLYDQLKFIVTT